MVTTKRSFLVAAVALSLTAGCGGGGGGGTDDSPTFDGVYDGVLTKVSDTCDYVINEVPGPLTVTQEGNDVVVQERGANGTYTGTVTSANSLVATGSDNCAAVTYQFEEITEQSATVTYTIDSNNTCSLVPGPACQAVYRGTLSRS